jgi:hypothetical protein
VRFHHARSDGDDRHDRERIGFHDDDFIIHDEVAVAAPLRVNGDDHARLDKQAIAAALAHGAHVAVLHAAGDHDKA